MVSVCRSRKTSLTIWSSEKVISVNKSSLADELNNDWSDAMKAEIRTYMSQVENDSAQIAGNSSGTHGLDTQTVARLVVNLKPIILSGVGFLNLKPGREHHGHLTEEGSCPLYSRAPAGPFSAMPAPIPMITGDDSLTADLTYGQGPVDGEGTVQIRMWVQEAATGNVIWTNRVKVQVSPESVLPTISTTLSLTQLLTKV